MSLLRSLRKSLAPDYSTRATAYGILRESLKHPSALWDRLNSANFKNYSTSKSMNISCNVCGERSGVYYDFPGLKKRRDHGIGLLRETLTCRHCGATMRHRILAHGLLEAISRIGRARFDSLAAYRKAPVSLDILDSDSYSPLNTVLRGKAGYLSTTFVPSEPFGKELSPGIFNIDLQANSFESDRFDVLLTSDVMEHVPDDRAAHIEIQRVLKPGGCYVFTVPCNLNQPKTRILAHETPNGPIFMDEPHFHGDPITGGILAYRIYGAELLDELKSVGLQPDFLWIQEPQTGILNGDCFIATKLDSKATA